MDDLERERVVRLAGDAEVHRAARGDGAETEGPLDGGVVQQVEPAGRALDVELEFPHLGGRLEQVHAYGGELLAQRHLGVDHLARAVDVHVVGVQAVSLAPGRDRHLVAEQARRACPHAGGQGERPLLDGPDPVGVVLGDIDRLAEHLVGVPADERHRMADRFPVGERHVQVAGARYAVLLDRAADEHRQQDQKDGQKALVDDSSHSQIIFSFHLLLEEDSDLPPLPYPAPKYRQRSNL